MTRIEELSALPAPSSAPSPFPGPSRSIAAATTTRLELLLIFFVLALAFLLASFPARNSDVWMHLANGKLLAHGEDSIGTDLRLPGLGLRVGTTWLYDLGIYLLYSLAGGAGLVMFKALVVAGLGLLLLRLSWSAQGWWIPAACTVLALVAMSIRLLLLPATFSYFFLALTLWFLQPRIRHLAGETRELQGESIASLPSAWPLLVLFLVWVNVDGWFLVGLGTVALAWLGRTFDEIRSGERPEGGRVASLVIRFFSLVLLFGVCLLNPARIHAFALPRELGYAALAQEGSSIGEAFRQAFDEQSALWNLPRTPAGWAYLPLLVLGLLSFFLNLSHWQWQRFLPWFGLALLSILQVRTVPFFAVVAGPVLAWNLQEFLAARVGAEARRQANWQWAFSFGRFLVMSMVVVLLACAWPGFLQGPPHEPRRWAVETSASIESAATATGRWLREGKLGPDAKGLHLSSETANAFAWFCPAEKGLRDEPLASVILGRTEPQDNWRERMRSAGVDHVILYDADPNRLFATLGRLLATPQEWPLLYLEGDVAVFGWRDPAHTGGEDRFQAWQLDWNQLAFRPAEDKKAPPQPSEREPEVRQWWEAFWKPTPPRPIDRDEATLFLFCAEAVRRDAPFRHQAAWEGAQIAGLIGAASGWSGPAALLDADLRLTLFRPVPPERSFAADSRQNGVDKMAHGLQLMFAGNRDDIPPSLLYLAIRAARRAVAANPDEARAYLVLGECYLRLLDSTRERAWAQRMPDLLDLRHVQASAALNQAIHLRSDFPQAHFDLYQLYKEMHYYDLAEKHLRIYLNLAAQAGPAPGISAEVFWRDREQLQNELNRFAKVAKEQENVLAVETARARLQDRALMAQRLGLAGKALDILLASDIAAFGAQGMKLELDLLLGTGQPKKVLEWTSPEQISALGAPIYFGLRTQACAASGEYALATVECDKLNRSLEAAAKGSDEAQLRELMAASIAQGLLSGNAASEALPHLYLRAVNQLTLQTRVADWAKTLVRQANVAVLRGLIALEQGATEEAEIAFREALILWKDEETPATGGGLDFNGRAVAQGYLEWLK